MSGDNIVGWTSDDKVPGFVGEEKFGQGKVGAGSQPFVCLCVGLKTSAGSAVANQDVVLIQSTDDADAAFGPGSELAEMCYAALLVDGVTLYGAAVPENGSGVKATATITVDGASWTTSGTWFYRICGRSYTGGLPTTSTPSSWAADIVAQINGDTKAPFTAASAAGSGSTYVVTITSKQASVRALQHCIFQDTTQLPTTGTPASSVLAGGASLTGGGKRFVNGAGVESLATLQGILDPSRYNRVAVAQADAASLYTTAGGNWRDYVAYKAGPLVGLMEQLCWGAIDATQPTLNPLVNDQRMQGSWLQNSENSTARIAASMAALRSVTEQSQPNTNYDDMVLKGLVPQSQPGDKPTHTVSKAALNNGITPLYSTPDGKVAIVRAITSHTLNGAVADYRTLDCAQSAVPDFCRDDLSLLYLTETKPANPFVDSDPDIANGEDPRPEGVLTPSLWNADVLAKQHVWEAANLITDLPNNVPVSTFHEDTDRIMTVMPIKVRPQNHQLGVSVRQIAS